MCVCVCGGGWVGGCVCVCVMEPSDSSPPVAPAAAAAVWPHPEPAAHHVHRGLLPLAGSSATGPGNPHLLQVRHAGGLNTGVERK